jgi:hypothetical protein
MHAVWVRYVPERHGDGERFELLCVWGWDVRVGVWALELLAVRCRDVPVFAWIGGGGWLHFLRDGHVPDGDWGEVLWGVCSMRRRQVSKPDWHGVICCLSAL